jgi:hypothetical protein
VLSCLGVCNSPAEICSTSLNYPKTGKIEPVGEPCVTSLRVNLNIALFYLSFCFSIVIMSSILSPDSSRCRKCTSRRRLGAPLAAGIGNVEVGIDNNLSIEWGINYPVNDETLEIIAVASGRLHWSLL